MTNLIIYRYPFVAADILVSCMKIADALVKVKEAEVYVEEEIKEKPQLADKERVDTEEDDT